MQPMYLVGYVRRHHDSIGYASPASMVGIMSDQWRGHELDCIPEDMTPTNHHDAIVSNLKQPVGTTTVLGLCNYESATKFLKVSAHVLSMFSDELRDKITNEGKTVKAPEHPPAPTMQHHSGQLLTDEDIQAALAYVTKHDEKEEAKQQEPLEQRPHYSEELERQFNPDRFLAEFWAIGVFMCDHWPSHLCAFLIGGGIISGIAALVCG